MKAKSILIVDDEKNIRMTLSQALEALDVDLQTAVNGEEALEKLQECRFEVVLLDLKMPGMDGLKVLQRIQEEHPEIKVVLISAHGTVESATEAMKLGAADFIEKPFAPKEIRKLVKKMIDPDVVAKQQAQDYEKHIEAARECLDNRELDAAEKHIEQAIATDSNRPEALYLRGYLYEMRGDELGAQKQYRAALALAPGFKPANERLDRLVMGQ